MIPTADPSQFHPVQQRCFGFRKFLIRTFWVLVCLSVATVLWGLWYLNERGFSRHWRQMLTDELEQRGVHATIGRLNLSPLRGLVAKNVRIVDARDHGRVLAGISEVVLDLNYSNLVHGEAFINSIDLRNADASLPMDPEDAGGDRLDVSSLNARILLPPHQLYIAQAEADIHGLHVTASGRFVNPEKFSREREDAETPNTPQPGRQARKYLQFWDHLKALGGRPQLDLRFSGDLANPSQMFSEAVLHADQFTVDGGYQVQSLQITATYSEGLLRLNQCVVADKRGVMDASGTFRPATGEANIQLRSTLDLESLLHSAHVSPVLDDFVFSSPPTLELNGQANLNGKPSGSHFEGKLLGRISTQQFTVKSVPFEGVSADFSWDGDRWFVHEARLQHRTGDLILSAMEVPGEFRFALDSHLNPKVLFALLPPTRADKALSELDFQSTPTVHLEGHGPTLSLDTMEATGRITLGATRFRGVGINSLVSNLTLKNRNAIFQDFKIERPEGSGSGTFEYDFGKGEARLVNVKSTLRPTDVAVWIDSDRELPHDLAPYRFKTRPSLAIDGTVQFRNGNERTRLRIDVDGSCGFDYTFLKKNLSLPKVKGTVWVIRDRLKINDLEGTLFGGKVRGNADISLIRGKGDYTAYIEVENIDFPSLTKLYFDYDTAKGNLTGSYKFAGRGDVGRTIVGAGELTVTEGNVFAIPLFGPFSGILNELLPGAGYNQAHKATASFDMRDGIIHTDDLMVDGKGFSMLGGGKLFFVDDKIDFTIRINAQGAAGKLLSPMSKLFEYVADSSLSKPNWHPKRLPKGLFAPHPEPVVAPGAVGKEKEHAPH